VEAFICLTKTQLEVLWHILRNVEDCLQSENGVHYLPDARGVRVVEFGENHRAALRELVSKLD